MFNLIFVENYTKLNMSANYVNVNIDENIKLLEPNEEGFLKNIELTTSVFVYMHIFKFNQITLLASGL